MSTTDTNIKSIEFIEDDDRNYHYLIDVINTWYKINKNKIKIVSAIHKVVKTKNNKIPMEYKRSIYIKYTGDAGPDPRLCKHTDVNEKIINPATCYSEGLVQKTCNYCGKVFESEKIPQLSHSNIQEDIIAPTCYSEGTIKKYCADCGTVIEETPIPMIDHKYVSNGDGTHNCVNDGCDIINEPCSPNGEGDTCEKCGYVTPLSFIFKILTESINPMQVDSEFSQTLLANVDENVTWNLIDGELPTGISLNNDTGELYGTPIETGSYTFKIQANYNNDNEIVTEEKSYNITVANIVFTVTFNSNGGTCNEITRMIPKGDLIGTLPEATKDEYIFGGWFTDSVNGLKVDENYTINADVTLYARWGENENDINFGDAVSTFNMQYENDRTNYNNNPYTLYNFKSGTNGSTSGNLSLHVGFASEDNNSNNMTENNKEVILYIKAVNEGDAGYFDIGFDCDSYVSGSDSIKITRIENGVRLGDYNNPYYDVIVPYNHTVWIGKYNERTKHRFDNSELGYSFGDNSIGTSYDSGYAFTMNDIYINSNSYSILEVHFTKH